MFVATEIRGNIRCLVGGERNDQLVTGQHFNGSAHLYSSDTPQSTSDWLGGGLIAQGMVSRLQVVVFIFLIMAGGGVKASLNCDWVDDFDCSSRSQASNI